MADSTVRLATLAIILTAVVPCVARSVEIVEGDYEGRAQFLIRAPNATWYFDRAGGGFSRLVDRDGRDWIAFRKDPLSQFPASAAAGYRGIPNAVFVGPDKGAGHPGFDQCVSEIVDPNTIRATSNSGKWAWTWTFTDQTATFSMQRADPQHKWWFLYEGPIAGTFNPRNKFWGTNKGGPRHEAPDSQSKIFDNWRWVYFGDRDVSRVLFIVHHEADALPDTLWYLGSSDGGSASAPDGMVVFGFGRGERTRPRFQGAGQTFTVGLIDANVKDPADHAEMGNRIADLVKSR